MSGSASAGAERDALANHKRRAYRSVQEAREKLTYKSGGKPEFEYELLLMFVRNELSAAVTTPLLAIIVAMGAMFWAPPRELLIWLGTVFVSKGILISLCRQFIRAPRDDSKTPMWRAKITAAEFLYGVSLGGRRLHQPAHAKRGGAHLHLRLDAGRHLDAHAVRIDGDAHRLCRHLADDRRHRHPLLPARQPVLLGDGRHGGRRAHLFHLADERAQLDRRRHARVPRREGRADRRARAGEIDLRRGAGCAPRRPTSPSRASSPP